jgi:rare lipoprotein A (peptidoglycan hydrolase)
VFFALVLGGVLLAPADVSASSTGTTATYYHPSLHGLRMANGVAYNRWDPMIAANNWYPLGTLLKVTRQGTDQHIYVRVQDRGSRALTLDLSEAGFTQLGGLREGRIPVWIEIVTTIEGQGPRAVEVQPEESVAAPEESVEAPEESMAAPEESAAAPESEGLEGDSAPADAAGSEAEPLTDAPADLDRLPIARRIRVTDGVIFASRFAARM